MGGRFGAFFAAYGKTVQKSTRLVDSPKNRAFVNKEVIPTLEHKIVNGDFTITSDTDTAMFPIQPDAITSAPISWCKTFNYLVYDYDTQALDIVGEHIMSASMDKVVVIKTYPPSFINLHQHSYINTK